MPRDVFIGDVYVPSMLASALLALVVVSLITRFMHARGWMNHFANPPLVFMSLVVIFTVVFSSSIFPA